MEEPNSEIVSRKGTAITMAQKVVAQEETPAGWQFITEPTGIMPWIPAREKTAITITASKMNKRGRSCNLDVRPLILTILLRFS